MCMLAVVGIAMDVVGIAYVYATQELYGTKH